MTTIDLSPVVEALGGLAAAVISAAVPILVQILLKHLKVTAAASDTALIQRVADAAAGYVYNLAIQHKLDLSKIEVHNEAVAWGVNYVASKVPQTLAKQGVTEETVRQMVQARLGSLLAYDSNVSFAPQPALLPSAWSQPLDPVDGKAVVGHSDPEPAPQPETPQPQQPDARHDEIARQRPVEPAPAPAPAAAEQPAEAPEAPKPSAADQIFGTAPKAPEAKTEPVLKLGPYRVTA